VHSVHSHARFGSGINDVNEQLTPDPKEEQKRMITSAQELGENEPKDE
jgi:hypothetical protein